MSRFLCADWLRAVFEQSADHGNDVMMTQFVFIFLSGVIFREISTGMDVKNCQSYCKKQIDNGFLRFVVLSPIEMMSKCSKLFDEITRLRLVNPLEF